MGGGSIFIADVPVGRSGFKSTIIKAARLMRISGCLVVMGYDKGYGKG